MSTFTTTKLAGQRVLVRGTTEAQCEILDSSEWDEIKLHVAHHDAADAFDASVKEFFAPLLEAADAASKNLAKLAAEANDPAFTIVVAEGTEGVEAQPAETITLSRDSAILRMIESGDTSRLVWVGNRIEIIAA